MRNTGVQAGTRGVGVRKCAAIQGLDDECTHLDHALQLALHCELIDACSKTNPRQKMN